MTMLLKTIHLYQNEFDAVREAVEFFIRAAEEREAAGDTSLSSTAGWAKMALADLDEAKFEVIRGFTPGKDGEPGTIELSPRHFTDDEEGRDG